VAVSDESPQNTSQKKQFSNQVPSSLNFSFTVSFLKFISEFYQGLLIFRDFFAAICWVFIQERVFAMWLFHIKR